MRAKNVARTQVEQSRTLDAIPSWKDETVRTADIKGMAAFMETFGFPATHLGSITDHRMFLFIRDSYQREQRISKALAKVRAGKPNPTTRTKTVGTTTAPTVNSDSRNGLSFLNDVT